MNLEDAAHRVTWRIPKDTLSAIKKISGKTDFSQEEIGNIMMSFAVSNFDDFKPALEKFSRERERVKRATERATNTVSKLPAHLIEKLAGRSPEEIEKLLSNID